MAVRLQPHSTLRALAAAVVSSLIPGWGQWMAGRHRRATWMLSATAVLVAIAVWMWAQGELFLLKLSVQPPWILTLLFAAIVIGIFRLIVVVDAFRSVEAYRPPTTMATAGAIAALAAVALITVLPHFLVARYALLQHDLITSVFASEEPVAAPPTSTSPPPTSQPTTPPGTDTSTTTTAPTTTTTAPPLWREGERLNILLMGGDAGPGRRGIRTDTMIIVSVDPATGYSAMFGVPRNFVDVPLPPGPAADRFPDGFEDIANALYQFGLNNPELFPGGSNSGATAIKGGLGELLGTTIHYYAMVELQGFVDMIDALGGVTIHVDQRVYDAEYPHEDGTTEVIDILPGTYHMDGHLALAYARSRRSSDDYNRMGRQRCVLEALVEQADVASMLRAFPDLVPAIKEAVTTDIPISRLPDLIELLAVIDTEQIVTVRFIPPDFISGRDADRYPIPDVARIHHTVDTIFTLPPAEAIASLGLQNLDEACPGPEDVPAA